MSRSAGLVRASRMSRPCFCAAAMMVRMAQRVLHPLHRPAALPCPTRPQAQPRAARSPDTPPATACLRMPADAQPGLIRMLHTCRPAASAWTGTPARRRRPRPEQHRQDFRQMLRRQKLRVTQPHRRTRKTRTVLRRGRHACREHSPRHRPATTAAPTMNPMPHHLTKSGALEGRTAGAQPLRRPALHPTRTPHSPGNTPGHEPPHDPGAPHAAASPPCGPACAPSSPASSASDAGPPASQARRSKAACRCCGTSTQDGAPTPLSARQDAPLAPEAPRSLPPGAQPAPPDSRIPTTDKGPRCEPHPLMCRFIHGPNTHSTRRQSKTSWAVTFCHGLHVCCA